MSDGKDYRKQKTPRARKLQEIDRKLALHDAKRNEAITMSDTDYVAWRREDHRLMDEWWETFKSSDDLSIPF